MLRVSEVYKGFKNKHVLNGVSFDLEEGEFVGVIGPSNGGKSVLLKIIAKVLRADSGQIEHIGRASSEVTSVGFSFQEGALFDSLTVIENIAFPLLQGGSALKQNIERPTHESAMERAFDILNEVGLAKHIYKVPGQLSGGMMRRAALARALVAQPDIVLLDDPTGGLDPVAASVIINLIKSLHKQYDPTVILVSHDLRRLLPNVARVLCLFDGQVKYDGCPYELRDHADQNILQFVETRFDFDAPRVENG